MARYIDASKLIQSIIKERDKIPLTLPCAYYELGDVKPNRDGQSQRAGIRKALRCIEEAPTADVVEVVRCENCLNWNVLDPAGNGGWCEKMDNGTSYNDFCSYGERRETNAE